MNNVSLNKIINDGESKFVEFKETAKNLEKEICAFANASGGTIYIGITDKGIIKPAKLTNKLKSQLQHIARSCEPSVDVQVEQLNNIITVKVFEHELKPVKCSSGFYMRLGANSQKLNRDEIFEFAIKEGTIKFDTQVYTKNTATDLLSIRGLEKFRNQSQLEKELENIQLLKNISCLVESKKQIHLTYAGLLLFGKKPQDIFPHATLTLLNMHDSATILEQRIIKGTLFDQLEEGMLFLQKNLIKTPKIEKLQREDILELPEFILRELLVNALIHRNYFESSADIVVKVMPDYIEFSNPGKPSPNIPIETLFGHSYRRNRILADVFYRAKYIERAGTGLLRVRKALKKDGLAPLELKEEGPFFIAILPRPNILHHENDLNIRQKSFFNLPKHNFPISTSQYAEHFQVSIRSARMDINEMLSLKLIEQIKKGRNIFYKPA